MSFNLYEFFKHSMVFPLYQLTAKDDSAKPKQYYRDLTLCQYKPLHVTYGDQK